MKEKTKSTPLAVITEFGKKRNATCYDCTHFARNNNCRQKFEQKPSSLTCHYSPSRYAGPGRYKPTQESVDMCIEHLELI